MATAVTRRPTARRTLPASAGVLAAAAALATAELVAGLFSEGPSPFVAVADAIIERTPGPIVAFAIATFGGANRLVLLTSMLLVVGVIGALVGVAAQQRFGVGPAVFGIAAACAAAMGVADPLAPATVAVLAPTAGATAGVLVLRRLLTLAAPGVKEAAATTDGLAAPTDPPRGSRRTFLAWAGTTAGVAAVAAVSGRVLLTRPLTAGSAAAPEFTLPTPTDPLAPPPPGASLAVDGISPLLTPNDDFYRIDTAFTVPRIDPAGHSVSFTGMVQRPFEIGYEELLDLADTEADVTLACVSNEIGGDLVGTARWLGVPLADLLDRAGVDPAADQIVGRAVDGWTAGFPVEAALDGRPALLAVGMNGEPLPARHGFPVRLVIAGLYGYVSDTKWLSEVELTTFDAFDAYWVPRGWAQLGPIKTQSRIDVPRGGSRVPAGPVAIAGVAWAGERGIAGVEVAIDDDWREAILADDLASSSWRQWVYEWNAQPGPHVLRVRATDGDGRTQESEVTPPRPDGATGHHSIRVTVT